MAAVSTSPALRRHAVHWQRGSPRIRTKAAATANLSRNTSRVIANYDSALKCALRTVRIRSSRRDFMPMMSLVSRIPIL